MTNRPGPKTVEIVALGAYNAIHSPGHSAYQETATGRASLTKPPSGKARLPGSAPDGVNDVGLAPEADDPLLRVWRFARLGAATATAHSTLADLAKRRHRCAKRPLRVN